VRRWLNFLLVFVVSVGSGVAWSWYRFVTVPIELGRPVAVMVAPGTGASTIARQLAAAGVVRSSHAFLLLARLRDADREFRHGEHHFHGTLRPDDVLAELVSNTSGTVRVTIPEGLTLSEIAKLMDESEIVSADEYLQAACAPEIVAQAAASAASHCTEGYLFPDTYNLAPTMTAAEVVKLQIARFHEVMRGILAELPTNTSNFLVLAPADGIAFGGVLRGEPAQTGIVQRTISLASIIEKETGVTAERGLVASVFHNRIRRGMRLQADPTVVYGLDITGADWDRERLHEYLRQPGPYNTYTEPGLPPGPICNPGELAIRAALIPDQTNFLYFVANADGTHRFSTTLAEHNRAIAEVRRLARRAS
jgi:UPF0755 protein